MTATMDRRQDPARPAPAQPPAPARPPQPPLPWAATISSAAAVLLAGAPVTTIVQGSVWPVQAVIVVLPVAAIGLALHRFGAPAVAIGQIITMLALLTVRFTDDGILGFIPGPAAFGEFGQLLERAGAQIDTSTAPVLATPEIRFLVTAAFGMLTIGVFVTAVTAAAPAAAGVPLLAVFAVPAALADELLPGWTMVAAALGYGLLLLTGATRSKRRSETGVALVAAAVLAALAAGAGTGFVGTAGRFEGSGTGAGSTSSIGLSPFTALRGQLDQSSPVELFRVRGLATPSYLRALTLREYVPGIGWQASPPAPGTPLPGAVTSDSTTPGELVDIDVENVAFRDYWLPLYGDPVEVAGLPEGQWLYDAGAGIAYSVRPKSEDGGQQRAVLPDPTADMLRQADGSDGAGPQYLDDSNVDPRVAQIAADVTAQATNSFDRAMALQDYFAGPNSQFSYSLQTAPGNGDDALVEFLTVGRAGYCEQFASAMAAMLRTVGVPSRVAVGFTAGTEIGDYRSISTEDAHAWVEAWFPGIGWTTFDPTPLTDGRSITPPYVEQARGEAPDGEETAPNDDISPEDTANLPTPEPVPVAEAPVTPAGTATESTGLPLWPFIVVLLLAVLTAVPAGLRTLDRRRRTAAVHAGGPAAAGAAWEELLAESVDRGVPIPATDTVRGTARRLVREHRLDEPAQQALRAVVTAAEASWYGGGHPMPSELDAPVRALSAAIAAGSGLTLRQRLFPQSVLRRVRLRRKAARKDLSPVG